jgi:hypothetical protein
LPLLDDGTALPVSRSLASGRPAMATKCNPYSLPGPEAANQNLEHLRDEQYCMVFGPHPHGCDCLLLDAERCNKLPHRKALSARAPGAPVRQFHTRCRGESYSLLTDGMLTSPYFSQAFYCGGGSGHVYCVLRSVGFLDVRSSTTAESSRRAPRDETL